jgi:hypothetical protein
MYEQIPAQVIFRFGRRDEKLFPVVKYNRYTSSSLVNGGHAVILDVIKIIQEGPDFVPENPFAHPVDNPNLVPVFRKASVEKREKLQPQLVGATLVKVNFGVGRDHFETRPKRTNSKYKIARIGFCLR